MAPSRRVRHRCLRAHHGPAVVWAGRALNAISVAAGQAGLLATTGDGATTELSWRWVRDHGEDEASFDPGTRQRRVWAIGPDEPKAAISTCLDSVDGIDVVSIEWPEEPSQTWISIATLQELLGDNGPVGPRLWNRADETSITVGNVPAVLSDDAALASWVDDLATFGFAKLTGFSGDSDDAVALANRIGYPIATIFGVTWELASDINDHDDTAYSQSFLAPHTDGTYSHQAPGLQMFCCVERDGTGGESIVVDGFAIAETLRAEYPAEFDVLTRVSVPGHYIEPGVELRASRPAIRLDRDGNIAQISMNNYDRSPMLLPPDEMAAFYQAYGRLHELAADESRWVSIRLEAGDVLINDNWRVLHGRQAYTGARRFHGCYLNHEDLESRCRTLGLAHYR